MIRTKTNVKKTPKQRFYVEMDLDLECVEEIDERDVQDYLRNKLSGQDQWWGKEVSLKVRSAKSVRWWAKNEVVIEK
jgi:hypothetical protein